MPAPNRFLDDLSRLMTDALGVADAGRREAETMVRTQIDKLLRDADVVSREEFEAVRAMAILARDENERLAARLVALEERIAMLSPQGPSSVEGGDNSR